MDFVGIYVNDHLAMVAGELDLAQRISRHAKDQALRDFLAEYVSVVRTQQNAMRQILKSRKGREGFLKATLVRGMEKLGRFKPNGHLLTESPLTKVVELEGLMLAADARGLFWGTVRSLRLNVNGFDPREMRSTTEEQRSGLDFYRQLAIQQGLAHHVNP